MKSGWEGIEVLDKEPKGEPKDRQIELDKAFARTFETTEGKKVLDYLASRSATADLGTRSRQFVWVCKRRPKQHN